MPSDAAMKLAERIVDPIKEPPNRKQWWIGLRVFKDREYAEAYRAAEVARIAAIIDEGLAEAHDAACEACAAGADEWKRPGVVKLAAGEMTAQELRTAQAVAGGIAAACRELKGAK